MLLLDSLVLGSTGEEQQCMLSQLQQSIKDYSKEFTFFPTLKKLKKLYPGDSFKDSVETACDDLIEEKYCEKAAREGCCNGTNHKLETLRQSLLAVDEYPKQLGFHLRAPDDICLLQIQEMQK